MNDEKMNKLSMIEQSLQNFLVQKQNFQAQLLETESALKELKGAKVSYKMVGGIMVNKDPQSLVKEIEEKRDVVKLRISSIEKQEAKLQEQAKELQKDVMKGMK